MSVARRRARFGCPGWRLALGLGLALGLACGDASEPAPSRSDDEVVAQPAEPVAVDPDPIEPVYDCEQLRARAQRVTADLALLPVLCPGIVLDRAGTRVALLEVESAAEAAAWITRLDEHPELQGLARLAALDRSTQPLPSELPDPATALLTPIDDRLLAAVELAYLQLARPSKAIDPAGRQAEEIERTRAHAFLARVHIEGLHALGLSPGRPLPPFARLLAARALLHGRSFCRFYWQRRVAGLERVFADTELELLALLIDLENTAHASDSALLALERQRTREYLERGGPASRIAAQAQRRPEARALGIDLLLPFAQEIDRLFDHRLIDHALDRAIQKGGDPGGYGLDPVLALVTEDLRVRDLREYERRLAKRVERARKQIPKARHEAGARELEPELPVEWPSATRVAEQAHAWLSVAHQLDQTPPTNGQDAGFARRHAIARAFELLDDRPDALLDLLERGPSDPVVAGQRALLFALLDARDTHSIASLRARVAFAPNDPRARETALRRSFALATRDALVHPR